MDWFRLWHEMPNDPKWRTIARKSDSSISEVISVAIHLMCEASNASERGRTQQTNNEHIASALDLNDDKVTSIKDAMQGNFLDGDMIVNWSKRQPKREDNSAQRAKEWREKRKRTQANANERPDTDTEEDTDKSIISPLPPFDSSNEGMKFGMFKGKYPSHRISKVNDCYRYWCENKLYRISDAIVEGLDIWVSSQNWKEQGGKFVPSMMNFLKDEKWKQRPDGFLTKEQIANAPF